MLMTKFYRGMVPPHVAKQYGSARAFKAAKRSQLKRVLRELDDLRNGCAYFPCGSGPVDAAGKALHQIKDSICAKYWGR